MWRGGGGEGGEYGTFFFFTVVVYYIRVIDIFIGPLEFKILAQIRNFVF